MSNGELLEGFKQGSGMNCCPLFKNLSNCCVEDELWGSKYRTGKSARRLCYNPDEMTGSWMRVVTLEMERSGWLWETQCLAMDCTGDPDQGVEEERKRS